MFSSIEGFFHQLIDYAGLFPPAALPMKESFENYIRYQHDPSAWILGRFLCPATRIDELTPFAESLKVERPPFSMICRGGAPSEFLAHLSQDLQKIGGQGLIVENLEMRLSADFFEEPKDLLKEAEVLVSDAGLGEVSLFYEIPFGEEWKTTMPVVIDRLTDHHRGVKGREIGFKLRCGGTERSHYPTSEQVAWALQACSDRNLRFKATAGLHHPFRHLDQGLQAESQGFVNLFGAGVLARTHHLRAEEILEILESREEDDFEFEEDSFTFGDWDASTEEIVSARKKFAVSYGSCSFEEPVASLKKLGWI